MPASKHTPDQRRHFAERASVVGSVAAAAEAGTTPRTVRRWCEEHGVVPAKVAKLGGRRGRPDVATSEEKADLAEAARARLPQVEAAWDAAFAGNGDPLALQAAGQVLDRGWGKPPTSSTVHLTAGDEDDDAVAGLRALAEGLDG